MEKKYIIDIKVMGLEKIKKDKISGKRNEFILQLKWSDNTIAVIYRPHSMLFDFQAILVEMFKSYRIPTMPFMKFHWGILKKIGIEKDCKAVEDFCMKIIQLPDEVSKSSLVFHFFDLWGTDKRTNVDRNVDKSSGTNDKKQKAQDEQYKVVEDFLGTGLGEVSLVAGELVTVMEKDDRGWWFVACNSGKQGWAPATRLESLKHKNKEFSYNWVSVINDKGKGLIYKSISAYNSQNEEELSISADEEVEVLEKSQYGWWKIRYQGRVGLAPATNLRCLDEDFFMSDDKLKRVCSISSENGLYAIIRKPPPKRDSQCSHISSSSFKINQSEKNSSLADKPSKYVYSKASFSGGSFVIQDHQINTIPEIDFDIRRASDGNVVGQKNTANDESLSYQCLTKGHKSFRSKSTGDAMDGIFLNDQQNMLPTNKYVNQTKPTKPGTSGETEFYIALLDYTPGHHKNDDLLLRKGDIVQLISADSGWMFVMLIEQENINNTGKQVCDIPKPRPRPRPSPRPLDQPKASKILDPNDRETPKETTKHPSHTSSEPKLLSMRYISSDQNNPNNKTDLSSRVQMPAPLLNDICNVRKYDEDLYDKPEMPLRSVYDSEPWFFGNISRADCERILSTYGRQQEFLVRESQRAPGSYALSVKYCYRIRHFPIELQNNQLFIGKLGFTNLMDIISYYQKSPLFYSEHKEPITLGACFSKDNVPK
ncbi:uncharacterized protein LOC101236248 isoform X2 [Hydra vulgaris]|uniref:uncharacterized protein LOC101236248 isoform X2 n=1 Tax=Hydra vulgaris TaxID=6087 RepID=UPI001F5F33DB|nr:uncharacterized protein LOC101236248 isoform X2 [Hydra vulgaris]